MVSILSQQIAHGSPLLPSQLMLRFEVRKCKNQMQTEIFCENLERIRRMSVLGSKQTCGGAAMGASTPNGPGTTRTAQSGQSVTSKPTSASSLSSADKTEGPWLNTHARLKVIARASRKMAAPILISFRSRQVSDQSANCAMGGKQRDAVVSGFGTFRN